MEIIYSHNPKDEAGKLLNSLITSYGDTPLLFLSSGGSSLELLENISDAALVPTLTVGMLDDRYSFDEKVNSFHLIKSSEFYSRATANKVVFLDSSVKTNESLQQYAERYGSYIDAWRKQNDKGKIIATVGIGPDGHTSGILPFPENPSYFNDLFNSEPLIVGYDVDQKNPHRYRMTSTFTLIRLCSASISYVMGENKREALDKVLAEEGALSETPGRIIRELKNATLVTDIK